MKLTDKQKLFCKFYIENPVGSDAAIKAGYTEKSSRSTASTLLTNPNIIQYLAFLRQTVEEIFQDKSKAALETMLTLMNDKKTPHTVRYRCAADILDRAGHKATDKVKVTGNIEHSGNVSTTKEVHLIQQLVNSNEEVADTLLRAIRERNATPAIPEDVEEHA